VTEIEPSRPWRFFPVRGKIPALPGDWRDHSTSDEKQLDAWLTEGFGLALDCGASGVTVIDPDADKITREPIGDAELAAIEAEAGSLPETYTVRTPGGGRHLYFSDPEGVHGRDLAAHVNVRSRGGYVVFDDGNEGYKLDKDLALAPLPAWVRERVAVRASTRAKADHSGAHLPTNLKRAAAMLEHHPVAVEGAGGDNHTYATINKVLDIVPSDDPDVILDTLSEWNDRCDPPWDGDELRIKIENALAYRQNDVGAWAVAPLDQRFGAALAQLSTQSAADEATASPQDEDDDLVWLHLGDLYRATPKPIEEILPGFVQKGVFNLLAGAGGTHKSRFCWQLVLSARVGADMLGRPVTQASGVVVSYEDPRDDVVRRVQALRDRLALPPADNPFDGVHYADRHGKRTPLAVIDEDGEIKLSPIGVKFFARIKAIPGHKLVVVDSLYNAFRFLGQAKIAENAVNALIGWLDGLCVSHDCTIIGIFHPSTAGNATGDARGYSHAWYDAPRAKVNLAKASDADRKGLALRRDQPLFKLLVDKRNSGTGGVEALLIYDEGALMTPGSVAAAPPPGDEAIRLAVYETMQRLLTQDPPITIVQRNGDGWKWKEVVNQIASDKPNMILTESQLRAAWAALMVPNAATNQPALLGYRPNDRNTRGNRERRAGFYLLDAEGEESDPVHPLANELTPQRVYAALDQLGARKVPDARKPTTVTDHALCDTLASGDPTVAAAYLPEVRAAAKLADYAHLLAKVAKGRASNAWQIQDDEW
jgi:RecA-family ATPase